MRYGLALSPRLGVAKAVLRRQSIPDRLTRIACAIHYLVGGRFNHGCPASVYPLVNPHGAGLFLGPINLLADGLLAPAGLPVVAP